MDRISVNVRKPNYDLLRIIMAFLVVVIHVNAYFLNVEESSPSLVVIAENFINVITRVAVPSFFMLSGALVLDGGSIKDTDKFYKRAIYKIFIPFVTVYLFWGLWYTFKYLKNSESLVKILSVWVECTFGNLWFMPVLCAIYMIAPLLCSFLKSVGNKTFEIVTWIIVLWGGISDINYLSVTLFNRKCYFFPWIFYARLCII